MRKDAGGVPARVLLIGCGYSLLTAKGRVRKHRLRASARTAALITNQRGQHFLILVGQRSMSLARNCAH